MATTYKPPHIPNFSRFARLLSEHSNRVMDEECQLFAERERESFVQDIERQRFISFHLWPLSEKYKARKRAARADPRVMIATHWYIDHIRVWRHRDTSQLRRRWVQVGFHPRVKARDLKGRTVDITLNRLAHVHESGSDKMNIPARPHWRPHLQEMTQRAPAVRQRIRRRVVRATNNGMGW